MDKKLSDFKVRPSDISCSKEEFLSAEAAVLGNKVPCLKTKTGKRVKRIVDGMLAVRKEFDLPLEELTLDKLITVLGSSDDFTHQAIALRVRQILGEGKRQTDVAARFGWEEFVVVLPWTRWDHAALFAEKIRRNIMGTSIMTDRGPVSVTVSIGVWQLSEWDDANRLFSKTDTLVYVAKRAGKNRVAR